MRKFYLSFFSLLAISVTHGQIQTPAQTKKATPKVDQIVNLKSPPALFAPGCDTLLFSPTVISQYGAGSYRLDFNSVYDSGYLGGVNFYGDKQKGNYFDVSSSVNKSYVTGVRFAIAKASSSVDMSRNVYFRVYDVATNITLAGSSAAIPLSGLQPVLGSIADYVFPAPIPLGSTKEFIISVDFSGLSTAAGDTFSIYTSNLAINAPDSAVEQWEDNRWFGLSSSWQFPNGVFVYLFPYVSDNVSCALTTPVKFSTFTGGQLGAYNKLKWTSLTEIDNNGFEIERSVDGNRFEKINFVISKAPMGNSSQAIGYEFIDEKPVTSANYYRLKQVDHNGKVTYSNVVLVSRKSINLTGIIAYYPNPVKSSLNLQLAASHSGNAMISVTNMSGATVLQQPVSVTGSVQNITLNVSNLPKGTYFVKLSGEKVGAKFIKE